MITTKKGYNCCSDSLIAVHYVKTRDLFRLDMIIETLEEMNLKYKKLTSIEKKVTFKDIYDCFMSFDEFLERWRATWKEGWNPQ